MRPEHLALARATMPEPPLPDVSDAVERLEHVGQRTENTDSNEAPSGDQPTTT